MPLSEQTGLKSNWHLSEDRLDEYTAEVHAAKQRWRGKLEVYLGVEVDYIKGLRSAKDRDIKTMNPDYIIGSMHFLVPVNGAEPFTVDGPPDEFETGFEKGFGGCGDTFMHSYWDAIAEMIAIGGFDILGHVDIIKKNCQNKNYWNIDKEKSRHKEIARSAAAAGLIAEVNTGGINQNKTCDTYPSVSILHLFRKQNIPVIITADAHCASDLDGNYNIAIETIIEAGYSEHILFDKKLKEKTKWRKEKINKT
jgi:histidinol-phosphatase (PHP family)